MGKRMIIVGAGIGGLSAAIALRREGHEVVLLERAPRLDPVGAGITLFANAMEGLRRLGVAEAVAGAGAPAKASAILTADGRELTRVTPDLLEGAVAVHRGDLQAALVAAAGEIRLGREVVSVEQTGGAGAAVSADGSEEHGDLLIGADGLWSLVRRSITDAAPRYSGYTAWRGISPVQVEPGRLTESWGVGERFGLVDIGSQTYWFATANTPEGEIDEGGNRRTELIRRFGDWHAPIREVLEATPDSAILRNDIHFLDPLPRWSKGRIVLLGDAAHATTPGIGQGAAMAIEDAVVLAAQLTRSVHLPDAVLEYESIRRRRAELVLKLSRRVDRAAQLTNPLGWRLRNLVVRHTPARLQSRELARVVGHRLQ
jgi:2-polyprenyl-6-methoxyphenol hydroxylase-like FAD-dependent oxidoreductase